MMNVRYGLCIHMNFVSDMVVGKNANLQMKAEYNARRRADLLLTIVLDMVESGFAK